MTKIKIDDFLNLFTKNFVAPSVLSFIGTPGSGKTTLINQFIYYSVFLNNRIDYVHIFTSDKSNYQNINQNYVHDYQNYESRLKKILTFQKNHITTSCLIIFDDAIQRLNVKSKIIEILFSEFRHFNTSIIVGYQYVKKMPPLLREMFDYIFVFKIREELSRNAVYELINDFYPNKNNYSDEIKSLAQYNFIFYDRKKTKKQIAMIKTFVLYTGTFKSPPIF